MNDAVQTAGERLWRYAETLAGFRVVAFACLMLRRAADIM